MLDSADLIAFVPTTKRKEARRFYESTLGLRLVSEDSFAIVFDANGTMLRVVDVSTVRDYKAASFTILGWHVADIEKAVRELSARGVVTERFDGIPQDELGIWTSPSGARVAWFRDPDGNVLSVTGYAGREAAP